MFNQICFPEFNSNISIDSNVAYFWTNLSICCNIKKNFVKFGFTINYNDHAITWLKNNIPLKDPFEFLGPNILTNLNDKLCQQKEDDKFDCDILNNYSARILDTKY